MGGKKTTTTSDQKTQATTQLPAWMTQGGQELYGEAKAASDANPVQAYTGERVAPLAANQQQAGDLAARAAGAWQPQMSIASRMAMRSGAAPASSVNPATFDAAAAGRYMDPYTSTVQRNTLDRMREQDAMDHADLSDQVQGAHAFGGARHGILEALQGRDQAKARQDYIDSSNEAAYQSGRQQFNTDADRSLAGETTNAGLKEQALGRGIDASSLLGQLAEGASTLNTRDIGALAETGATAQSTEQAGKDAAYQDFLRMQSAPTDRYAQLMAILSGTPRDVTTSGTSSGTQTSKQSGSFLDTLLGIGQLGLSAAGTFSDPRLKKDVSLIERLANGLGVYRFRYLWEAGSNDQHIGCMADEVARVFPEALGPIVGGFLTVNYHKLRECLA